MINNIVIKLHLSHVLIVFLLHHLLHVIVLFSFTIEDLFIWVIDEFYKV